MTERHCIMGVDPGLRATGYAFISSDGRDSEALTYGEVRTDSDDELATRLGVIFRRIRELIREYRPAAVAIEDVFLANNPAVAIRLGHARGAVICAAVECDVKTFAYSAKHIKRAVVGRGGADKRQVEYMVTRLLNIVNAKMSSDAADALAAALCHANRELSAAARGAA